MEFCERTPVSIRWHLLESQHIYDAYRTHSSNLDITHSSISWHTLIEFWHYAVFIYSSILKLKTHSRSKVWTYSHCSRSHARISPLPLRFQYAWWCKHISFSRYVPLFADLECFGFACQCTLMWVSKCTRYYWDFCQFTSQQSISAP